MRGASPAPRARPVAKSRGGSWLLKEVDCNRLRRHQEQMRRHTELVPQRAPLPPQRFGFLPTKEFWGLALYTPLGALCCMGYLCLVGVIALLLGTSISNFAWWHHVLLAFTLSEVWSGIFELFCRRAMQRWGKARSLRHVTRSTGQKQLDPSY